MPGQPQNTPTVSKPTPIILDQLLIETSDSNKALYDRNLEFGHYHPDQIKYPGHRLLKQGPNAYGLYSYTWGNAFTAQDSYAVAKEYEKESASYPTFIHVYRALRSQYMVAGTIEGVTGGSATRGSAYTGVLSIHVTAGGTGYTVDFAISSSGGSGSGLTGVAIVDGRGAVVRVDITNTGSGYTSAPTIAFSLGAGIGAAGTAYVQPVAAVLIAEKPEKLTPDDPYYTLYDRVTRVYQILPGVLLTSKEMDNSAQGAVTSTTTQTLAIGDADYSPDFKTLSYTDKAIDANRKERTVTSLTDLAFPILTDYDQDPEMQSLITTTFQVVAASAVTPPTAVQGVITRYKHIDKWRSMKIVETYATPDSYSEQKFSGQNFPNLFTAFYHSETCGTIILQRGAFSAMVKIRLDISFGNFSAIDGLTLIPNTFAYGSFRVNDILNDAATLTSSGTCSYTMNLPASSPSKSAYLAYGSTLQLVSGECVYWKAGIFRKTQLYVKMI